MNQHEADSKQKIYAGFLLGVLFNHKDGGDTFLGNID
jgi:hypothetical protein